MSYIRTESTAENKYYKMSSEHFLRDAYAPTHTNRTRRLELEAELAIELSGNVYSMRRRMQHTARKIGRVLSHPIAQERGQYKL